MSDLTDMFHRDSIWGSSAQSRMRGEYVCFYKKKEILNRLEILESGRIFEVMKLIS